MNCRSFLAWVFAASLMLGCNTPVVVIPADAAPPSDSGGVGDAGDDDTDPPADGKDAGKGATDAAGGDGGEDAGVENEIVVAPGGGPITITEGTEGSFTVALARAVDGVITVTSEDPAHVTVTPATLTFTAANYKMPQTVKVRALADPNLTNETVNIALTADKNWPDVMVQVLDLDIDKQAVVLTPATGTPFALGEGEDKPLDARLQFQPEGTKGVRITSNSSKVTVSPPELMFNAANYTTPQTFTVSGVDDVDLANESVTLTVSTDGAPDRTITVNVTDDDVQRIVVPTGPLLLNENGTTTFGVRLSAQPPSTTTVMVTTSDPLRATAAPATLTFTTANYAVPQPVTLSAPANADMLQQQVTITLASSTIPAPATVEVDVFDVDAPAFTVQATQLTITEGAVPVVAFTVRLSQQPPANVTVSVMSSDAAKLTVSPATLTFTPANYATPQPITVSGAADLDLTDETEVVTLTDTTPPDGTGTTPHPSRDVTVIVEDAK